MGNTLNKLQSYIIDFLFELAVLKVYDKLYDNGGVIDVEHFNDFLKYCVVAVTSGRGDVNLYKSSTSLTMDNVRKMRKAKVRRMDKPVKGRYLAFHFGELTNTTRAF